MEYILTAVLTFIASWFILRVIRKKAQKGFSKTLYSQSDMHRLLKYFFSLNITNDKKPISQLTKRRERDMIRVIVMGDLAYWVSDNIFYVAEAINGEVIPQTAEPVDTNSMTRKDLDKMLFILDSLKNGNKNDSSSAGNE
jgi:hypothetical protein